ncbi:hypothetical protein [Delftia sp.]|uniref:hypothetical protein n=1 Tax=Delftia sp. TaxID=1886637 RepID=UPI00259D0C84|nr:hypothetical protein [Delftia sp.]
MAIVSAALPEESRLLHTLGLLASGLARQPVAVQALARSRPVPRRRARPTPCRRAPC